MADDLVDDINQYKKVLGKIPGSKFPEKFVLQDMIDLNEGKTLAPAADGPHTPELHRRLKRMTALQKAHRRCFNCFATGSG